MPFRISGMSFEAQVLAISSTSSLLHLISELGFIFFLYDGKLAFVDAFEASH